MSNKTEHWEVIFKAALDDFAHATNEIESVKNDLSKRNDDFKAWREQWKATLIAMGRAERQLEFYRAERLAGTDPLVAKLAYGGE